MLNSKNCAKQWQIMLKESLQNFRQPVYGKTRRTPDTYRTLARRCHDQIVEFVNEYHSVNNDQQLLREIRNDIDEKIRRYHEYCIKQRDGMGAHYHEQGLEGENDFEHLIPAARIRDLLLANVITVTQALNAPTVKLSREKHIQLGEVGWASHTPDMWLPFRRYSQVFDAQFETYDGTRIDPETWTLEQHFNYFKHLVI